MKMKKILALLCALAMVFTLAACGGGDDAADDNNGGDTATDGEEVTMKTVTLGDVSIDLPDFFGEPQETSSGALGVAGPESSVTVAGPVEMDITLDMWSEEFAEASLEGLFGATYTLELVPPKASTTPGCWPLAAPIPRAWTAWSTTSISTTIPRATMLSPICAAWKIPRSTRIWTPPSWAASHSADPLARRGSDKKRKKRERACGFAAGPFRLPGKAGKQGKRRREEREKKRKGRRKEQRGEQRGKQRGEGERASRRSQAGSSVGIRRGESNPRPSSVSRWATARGRGEHRNCEKDKKKARRSGLFCM